MTYYYNIRNFLNLSTRVINKLHIIEIVKKPHNYTIILSISNIDGWMALTSGNLSTNHNVIDVCEKTNKQDYDTVTNFIENIE